MYVCIYMCIYIYASPYGSALAARGPRITIIIIIAQYDDCSI